MKTKFKITLELNMDEAEALKKLTGNISDDEYAKFGIKGKWLEYMIKIYAAIPEREDIEVKDED